ncbi:MAG: TetR/AcrR family transcriptional regulator [Proteobacteria bacterium]|nr:TetR/AcrR family transcriptional regulator [Pseudomonadota bacterium]
MTPREENHEARQEKQAAIFDAACRVIREKGFHQARMADIAREAGISYGLVYHYFGSKSELFDALVEEWFSAVEILLDRGLDRFETIEEKLGAVADFFLDQYEKRPDLVHVSITEFSRSTGNLTPDRLVRFKRLLSKVEEVIRQAQDQGSIRPDIKARYQTYVFLGAVDSLLSTMVLENQPLKGQAQRQRLAQAILTIFFDGARPKSG